MCFMTPLTLWLAISNPISDCGCFGDAVVLTNWETFAKNVVLLIAAVSVFRGSRHLFKLVTDKVDWLVALYSFVFIIFFSTFTFRHLPVFDFRPYHIGSDIREKMEIPEGEKPSVLETVFIYAKEGRNRSLPLTIFLVIPPGLLLIQRQSSRRKDMSRRFRIFILSRRKMVWS